MRQPEPPDAVEQLREFLRFAVPLRIRELEYRLAGGEVTEAWLLGAARRGGRALGTYGDALMFAGRAPRTGRRRDTVIRTAQDLVDGIAATALIAGPDGVTVFGDHYTARQRQPNERAQAREDLLRKVLSHLDELEALLDAEGPAPSPAPARPTPLLPAVVEPPPTAKPRPIVDLRLPGPEEAA